MEGPGALRRAARFGNFELDLRSAELREDGGAAVRLGEQPFCVLLALLEHPGEVVLREELRRQLWPNNTIVEFEHSINASVNRLRRALGDSADKPRFIETLARRGYRWMVPVEWVERPPAPGAVDTISAQATAGPIGRKISHYRLLEVLGGGGMGIVYKAEDLKLGRHVALKFLGEEFTDDRGAIERFEHEARTLSALDHPNICTIYEVAEHEGHPFLAMQLLQGETLRQRIESVPGASAFAAAELLDIADAILAGLEAAHEKGIVHRDVKPANIFLTARGEVKLLDFGLAKLVADTEAARREPEELPHAADVHSTNLTMTGTTMGTASYMAPEQVRGEPVDARTDLFGFGVVLYEMATGRQPFRSATLEGIREAILTGTPPSPRELNPGLPAGLDALIRRLLEKEPERRFQSAREVTRQLETLRPAGAKTPATSASAAARTPRRRGPIFGASALALVVVAAGVWTLLRWVPPAAPRAGEVEIRKLTDSGRVEYVAISRDGRYIAYAQREADGLGLWLRRLADGRETLLVAPSETLDYNGLSFSPAADAVYFVRSTAGDVGFTDLYAVPTSGGPTRLLVKDVDSPVGFAPDGRRFAYTRGVPTHDNATEIHIADADGGDDHLLATVTDTATDYHPGPTWSPDGRAITVPVLRFHDRDRYALYKLDPSDGNPAAIFTSADSIGRALWMPGGTELLFMLRDHETRRSQLWAISYPRVSSRRLSSDLADYEGRADLSTDGRKLVAIARTVYANLWTASATDEWRGRQLTALSSPLRDVTEGPNGELLGTSAGHPWRFSADGRKREPYTTVESADALIDCGRFVVVRAIVGGDRELVRFDADGSSPLSLVAASDMNLQVCSPDGQYLYYADSGRIWRVAISGGRPEKIASMLGDAFAGRLNVSADGKFIAYAYSEFTPISRTRFALVPIAGGPPQRVIDLPGTAEHGSSGSPLLAQDGRSVDYVITDNGVSNVWEQELDGGGRRQLTQFTSGRIFDFNWSRDGKTLLLSRGEVSSDAVLMTSFQAGLGK